jgi:transposase
LGEDITETLEVIPRQWKVIQHVREKFTCRDCEKISQAAAPFHVITRGWAGPSLLAMILFEKYGHHQPLNRQAERYAKEGVPLSLSTLTDQVGACCAVLAPILRRVEAHVFAAERLHGDDTTVPVLAKGRTDTGRCWVYVRDDVRLAARVRRRRCSITRATGPASALKRIWPAMPGSSGNMSIERSCSQSLYGQHSERTVRLLDQMELAFEELESSATEDEIAAERAAAKATNVVGLHPQAPGAPALPRARPSSRKRVKADQRFSR